MVIGVIQRYDHVSLSNYEYRLNRNSDNPDDGECQIRRSIV